MMNNENPVLASILGHAIAKAAEGGTAETIVAILTGRENSPKGRNPENARRVLKGHLKARRYTEDQATGLADAFVGKIQSQQPEPDREGAVAESLRDLVELVA